jgi:hypothetical protein
MMAVIKMELDHRHRLLPFLVAESNRTLHAHPEESTVADPDGMKKILVRKCISYSSKAQTQSLDSIRTCTNMHT